MIQQCSINTRPAREGKKSVLAMMWTGNLALACLLLLAGFSDAARTPQQRRDQRNPYLILPPGSPNSYGEGRTPQDLGERDFVGSARPVQRTQN